MAYRNYYDDYGVQSGYNQTAPGKDVAAVRPPQGQPGRPRTATPPAIANAIMPPPQDEAAPQATPTFAGAQQTLGANANAGAALGPGGSTAGSAFGDMAGLFGGGGKDNSAFHTIADKAKQTDPAKVQQTASALDNMASHTSGAFGNTMGGLANKLAPRNTGALIGSGSGWAPAAPSATASSVQPQQAAALAAPTTPPSVVNSNDPNAPGTPGRNTGTTLMEGDPRKLADPAHIAKSPKYQFLSQVQNYGRGEEGALLDKLKADHPEMWDGWAFDGKGNFVYQGDPSKLAKEWNGVKRVDAFGSYNAGGPLKARWGAEDPNGSQGPAMSPSALQGAIAGGAQPNYLDPSVMQNAIMASGVPGATDYAARIKQQIQAALTGKL